MPLDQTLLYGFCSILIGIMTLAAYEGFTKNKSRFFFSFYGLSTIIWIISLFIGYTTVNSNMLYSTESIRLAFATPVVFHLFLTYFFYYFPRKKVQFPLWLHTLLISSTVILFGVILFSKWLHVSQIVVEGNYIGDELGPGYTYYILYLVAQLCIAIFLAYKKSSQFFGIEKRKLMIASSGLFLFSVVGMTTNVILPLFGIYSFLRYSVAWSLFFALPSFYALQKYRFFDISFLSLRILRQSVLYGAFILIIVLSHLGLQNIPEIHSSLKILISATMGLVTFRAFQKYFPELIPKQFREFKNKIQELIALVYSANNFQEINNRLQQTFVTELHWDNAQIQLVQKESIKIGVPVYLRDSFIGEIEKTSPKILLNQELSSKNKSEKILKEGMKKLSASACFPIYLNEKVIGLLSFGAKPNKSLILAEEIQELENTKTLVEIVFINALLQSDLHEENNLMKKLIDGKTKKLRQQNNRIKKLLKQQSDFIAVTAHEFRTPLNIALLQLNDTLDSFDLSHQVLDDMRVLESSLDKLKQLTQDLFDVQQYDLKKATLHRKKTDMNMFVEEVYEQFLDITKTKSINLVFKDKTKKPVEIDIDQPKIRQVLHNLLSNAQKFSPEKGNITILLEETKTDLVVSVIDEGKGVPDKDKKRVFKKFQTTNRHQGIGIGMGLYLCKQIVELHKGTIDVKDNPKGGAWFQVDLPKKP